MPATGEFAGKVVVTDDLAVRATISCEDTYVLTAADIDALTAFSTASVQAVGTYSEQVLDDDTATTSLDQVSEMVFL